MGDTAKFKVSATKQAANFYYEVVSRGKVVFSDFSRSPDLAVRRHAADGAQRPAARLPDPAELRGGGRLPALRRPGRLPAARCRRLRQGRGAAGRPGRACNVQTEGAAKVGLAAVDRSVFILAENRLNLQQVFDELERLYQKPQAELHEARPLDKITGPRRQGRLPATPAWSC